MLSSSLRHLSTLSDEHLPSQAQAGQPADQGASSQLEDRVDRLALICMAMWTLIQTETNLTEEDLLRRVEEIDLLDGTSDGKITRHVVKCVTCKRPNSSRHLRCIYCGANNAAASAFDTV